jgi:hypothetical protein
MRSFRGIAVCFCLACFLAAGLSAQTVAPVSVPTKELKRTAHQLRINVDHLKNARAALKEATDLARHSSDSSAFSQLSSDWVRIDKARAPAALEDLYGWLRTTARDAPDALTYQRCMSAAQSMLRQLATLDSDKAVSLWRMWPDPPAALGESMISLREQVGQFEKQLSAAGSGRGIGAGPGAGMDSTAANQQAAMGNYSIAASLAAQLNQSGDRQEALKVVDQAMATFRQGSQDPRALSSYLSFVQRLANVDPDRYLQGLSALVPSLSNPGGPNTGGTLTVGNQTLQLTAVEAAVIDLCRNLNGRPDLAMKTLDMIPGLKSKLNGIGGIDNIVGPPGSMNPSRSLVSMSYSIDGVMKNTYSTTMNGSSSGSSLINAPTTNPAAAYEAGNLLYQSVRGKLAKDPAFVKQKLADAAKTPDQIDVLINLANRVNYEDADLASLALELASQMEMQVEPLSKRASVMQQLIQAYQRCDGEVDAGLLQEGLNLVQQLRDEQNSAAAPMPTARGPVSGRGTMADQLEMAFVAELALDNFDGALKYLRLMPDDLKLQALLQIVQTLIQPF